MRIDIYPQYWIRCNRYDGGIIAVKHPPWRQLGLVCGENGQELLPLLLVLVGVIVLGSPNDVLGQRLDHLRRGFVRDRGGRGQQGPGRKSLIIQDLRHLYQYSTKYVAHIPSRQCTFLKGYLVQTYSRFVYIYPSSAGVSILKDIGCIHTRNMHQYTLL